MLCRSFLSGLASCRQHEQQFAILISMLSSCRRCFRFFVCALVLDQQRTNCSATERPRIVRGGRRAANLGTKEPHRVRLPRQVFPGLHQDGRRPTGKLFRIVVTHTPSCKPCMHPRVVLLRLLMSSLQSTLLQSSDSESKFSNYLIAVFTFGRAPWWQSQFIADGFARRVPQLRVNECVAAMM